MSIGKTLVNLSHRDRWLLFSTLVQSDKNYVPDGTRQINPFIDQNESFENRFFKKAERISRLRGIT
ncbi:MAG: hypothetical protein DWQ05_13605 [Calditrichaeota bacterium]|nr:MAG: hypothetical protein DWQ05_13605 [Calditrichota bacterium]